MHIYRKIKYKIAKNSENTRIKYKIGYKFSIIDHNNGYPRCKFNFLHNEQNIKIITAWLSNNCND